MALIDTCNNYQQDFKQHVPTLHGNMSKKTLDPIIELVELKFLKPYLGNEFYMKLCKHKEEGTLSRWEKKALKFAQKAVAFRTIYRGIDQLVTSVGDMGVVQNFGEKTQPADWKAMQLTKWDAYDTSWDMLECLLWDCLWCFKKHYPCWSRSDESAMTYDLLVNSPKIFNDFQRLPEKGRMRIWIDLRPFMEDVEECIIKKIICPELYCILKKLICECKGESSKYGKLLKLVRKVIVDYTLEWAMPVLNLRVTMHGLRMLKREDKYKIASPTEAHPDYRSWEHYDIFAEKKRKRSVRLLCDYLESNLELFPEFENSDCYSQPEECNDCCPKKCGCNCDPCCNEDQYKYVKKAKGGVFL